jgi:ketosteroid isomerase-like protein
MTPYDALAELARRELELVSSGDIDELPALHARRASLVTALPATPPPAARPALERTAALQARVTEALAERVRDTGADLGRIGQGRTAMRGYAPPVERHKLVDQAG